MLRKFFIIGVFSLAGISLIYYKSLVEAKNPYLPKLGQVPDFSLIQTDGNIFHKNELNGKIWVADFIFTRCNNMCPILSGRFTELQSQLKNANIKNVRLVSFSVDPTWDTPERLQEYAERFLADKNYWTFLTGERKKLYTLIKNGFKLSIAAKEDESVDDPNQLLTHSDRMVLIDGEGNIRAYYHGMDDDTVEKLFKNIKQLVGFEQS